MNAGDSRFPGTGIIPLDPGFNCMHNSLESMEKPAEALNGKTIGNLLIKHAISLYRGLNAMVELEVVYARGHPNIRATHYSTLEVTKEEHLSERGDCIIGVGADKSPRDFSPGFKDALRSDRAILIAVLRTGEYYDIVLSQGSSRLILDDPVKLIIRRSSYIEPATIGVRANKAARDLDRSLIALLRDPGSILELRLYVIRLDDIQSVDPGSRSVLEH